MVPPGIVVPLQSCKKLDRNILKPTYFYPGYSTVCLYIDYLQGELPTAQLSSDPAIDSQ